MTAVGRAIAWVGWAVLAAFAAVGLALAALAALAEVPLTRPLVASRVVRFLDEAIAGSLVLKGVSVLPQGGIELRGLEVYDPHGHLVLYAGRARFFVDVTALRNRTVGVTVELESPSVMLEEEQGGGFSIARAFEPPQRAREGRPGSAGARGGGSAWTLLVSRLTIRGGEFWWVDARGATRLEASGLDLDGRGLVGPGRGRVDLRLRGSLDAPVAGPVALDVAGGLAGSAFRIPALQAELGGTRLAAVAEGDLAQRRGRIAVSRLGVERGVARALAPRTPAGDDLSATAYAESDGSVLTVALRAEPAGQGARGRADAAVAARLSALASALGFDAALDHLDPSRLVAGAPSGDVTLTARGALSGRSLSELRGRLGATVQRSRFRSGEVARAEIVARADRGTVEVSRVSASAPGLEVDGTLRWREGGEVGGRIAADAKNLRAAMANLGALLGEKLPAMDGRARVDATLSGTSAAPRAAAEVDAPAFRVGDLALGGAHLTAELAGPRARPSGRVEGRIASVRGGGGDVAHGVALRGTLSEDEGVLTLTAALPGFRDPASIEARGRLDAAREAITVSVLDFAYPGARWTLSAPATVKLAGPSVDRLELAADPQRIVVRGGLVRGRTLDASAELTRVDLARLPAGLLTSEHDLKGILTGEVTATGTVARPELAATLSLAGGAVDDVDGLALTGSARWSGRERRLRAALAASRKDGGTADVDVDLPLPAAGRPAERVLIRVRTREVPLEEVLAAAGSELPLSGLVALDAAVEGTVGMPTLSLGATLSDAEWKDLGGLAFELAAEDPGEKLRLSLRAALEGKSVVAVDAEVPLDVSTLLERPAAAVRAARAAPLEGSLAVRGLDVGALSGRAGIPPRLAGIVDVTASFRGTTRAPRAKASVELRGGAWSGYRDLSGGAEVSLADAAVSAKGRLAMGGDEALRFDASLDAPLEKIGSSRALGAAPIRADLTVPRIALARAATPDLPLAGTMSGHVGVTGTLRAPEVAISFAGEGVAVQARPLGNVRLEARYARARTSGEVVLAAAAGGSVKATFALGHDFGLGAPSAELRDAPAEITAVGEALDLGFLPAAAPGVVRSAGGKLSLDARASGPLARLAPRGSLQVKDGKLAISEWGDWTGIALEARVTENAVEVSRLEVHRGSGSLTASGSLRGLRSSDPATLEAHLASDGFTVARAGMDVARVDLRADATGTYDGTTLAVAVKVPRGIVRLPKRTPRALQALQTRGDIVVGRRVERKRRPASAGGEGRASERPFTLRAALTADRNLFVKSDDPRIDLELRANVTYERTGSDDYVEGSVEVIHGNLEPIGGRNFVVERGRLQFTGGPPSAALLDFQARYDNPVAVVTATVQGPMRKPKLTFTSEPALAEQEIAMLIATGRTDLKAGAGGVATLSGEEAGKAALGVLATQAFKNLVADKLPVDTVSVDSAGFRAGKYLTEKFYVVYTRRFDADPLRGENTDEVRVEYQITPRWMFESRWGNAQSGGANLVWSRDY
ncbi:MAG TPA: translocation/assembly module TamB domain-containing protein [Anaeromyxobacter sp.]